MKNEQIEYLRTKIRQNVAELLELRPKKEDILKGPSDRIVGALSMLQMHKNRLRKDTRALYLAYGYVRGKDYHSIERKCDPNLLGYVAWDMIKHLHLGVPPKDFQECRRLANEMRETWLKHAPAVEQA